MSLKYDAEGMAFPDDFSDVPAVSLETVIMDELSRGQWEPEEYATCEAAFAADYELSLLPKGEVFIDGEPPFDEAGFFEANNVPPHTEMGTYDKTGL